LIQEGYIARTPRGRVAMDKSFKHLGRKLPGNTGLFNDQ